MYNYRFDAFEEQDGTWVVTIYCNSDPIFMSTHPNGIAAASWAQGFVDCAHFLQMGKIND